MVSPFPMANFTNSMRLPSYDVAFVKLPVSGRQDRSEPNRSVDLSLEVRYKCVLVFQFSSYFASSTELAATRASGSMCPELPPIRAGAIWPDT